MSSNAPPEKALKDWIALRATAALNIPLCIWLAYSIADLAGADYATFTGWLSQPLNAGLLIVFVVSVFYHAALGCHEIIEDYVHDEKVKALSLRLKAIAFFILGAVCVVSILKVAIV